MQLGIVIYYLSNILWFMYDLFQIMILVLLKRGGAGSSMIIEGGGCSLRKCI